MLLFPNLTQLDLTGPYEVFYRIPDARVHLVWKNLSPVVAQGGMSIVPTTTIADCPPLDLVFVPGGFGQLTLQDDEEILGFLRRQGATARWVTSVCTGSLLLGAAGLLDGYAATSHWAYVEFLERFGARYEKKRVVVDRNRITAGGVTSGIDFGLRVAAEIGGETLAKALQLGLEYDPAPPFTSGHPDVAEPQIVDMVRARLGASVAAQRSKLS
jgi:cyclohexyl-isocyanide hydratase